MRHHIRFKRISEQKKEHNNYYQKLVFFLLKEYYDDRIMNPPTFKNLAQKATFERHNKAFQIFTWHEFEFPLEEKRPPQYSVGINQSIFTDE